MRNVFVTKISLPNAAPNFRGSETDSRNAGVMLWCHLNINYNWQATRQRNRYAKRFHGSTWFGLSIDFGLHITRQRQFIRDLIATLLLHPNAEMKFKMAWRKSCTYHFRHCVVSRGEAAKSNGAETIAHVFSMWRGAVPFQFSMQQITLNLARWQCAIFIAYFRTFFQISTPNGKSACISLR